MKNIFSILLIVSSIIHGQVESQNSQIGSFEEYQLSSQKYISDDQGQIFMKVNVWGEVGSPGSHVVYDGIDFASLLSLVGGPSKAANLKNVRLYREEPDKKGNLVYTINLDKFIKYGDRSSFIKIYPNDTIIIQSKLYSQVLERISSINLFLSLFTITLQVLTLFSG
tara:strand:- start:758 stop:1258 length:501 start_codon:yes stop_codon:yes gene_type:complete